jgi:hypothetical protein
MRICVILLSLIVLVFASKSEANPVSASDIPYELKRFIPPGTRLLDFAVADLNGDDLRDYIFVTEDQEKGKGATDVEEERQRTLFIAIRSKDGALKIVKKNDSIVFCSTCGGVMGDPYAGIEASGKTFTVSHYGGSAWRWQFSYKFNYSRIDDTWQLVRVEETTFNSLEPDRVKTKIYRPPKDFGKIDIADFKPDSYGKGRKR